jgi:hypothetical protein
VSTVLQCPVYTFQSVYNFQRSRLKDVSVFLSVISLAIANVKTPFSTVQGVRKAWE